MIFSCSCIILFLFYVDTSMDVTELAEVNNETTSTQATGDFETDNEAHMLCDNEESMDINEAATNNDCEFFCGYDGRTSLELTAAHFVLNLKEKFKLSQASLNFAIKGIEKIIEVSTNNIQDAVIKNLSITTSNIEQCFSQANPFINLKIEYQQTKYFKEHFGYIVRMYNCKNLYFEIFNRNLQLFCWVLH